MAIGEERRGSLKPILFLAVWGAVVLVGAKAFPVYSGSSKLADHIRDLALHASMEKTAANKVQGEIVRYARSLVLPIADNEVRITCTYDTVQINLDYTVPVRLGIFTWNLRFTPSVESRAYN